MITYFSSFWTKIKLTNQFEFDSIVIYSQLKVSKINKDIYMDSKLKYSHCCFIDAKNAFSLCFSKCRVNEGYYSCMYGIDGAFLLFLFVVNNKWHTKLYFCCCGYEDVMIRQYNNAIKES